MHQQHQRNSVAQEKAVIFIGICVRWSYRQQTKKESSFMPRDGRNPLLGFFCFFFANANLCNEMAPRIKQ